jgi:hypothetical protein
MVYKPEVQVCKLAIGMCVGPLSFSLSMCAKDITVGKVGCKQCFCSELLCVTNGPFFTILEMETG